MAWQYCEMCDHGIDPNNEDIIKRYVDCECGEKVMLNELEDAREVLIIEMYRDIQKLKEKVYGNKD